MTVTVLEAAETVAAWVVAVVIGALLFVPAFLFLLP